MGNTSMLTRLSRVGRNLSAAKVVADFLAKEPRVPKLFTKEGAGDYFNEIIDAQKELGGVNRQEAFNELALACEEGIQSYIDAMNNKFDSLTIESQEVRDQVTAKIKENAGKLKFAAGVAQDLVGHEIFEEIEVTETEEVTA